MKQWKLYYRDSYAWWVYGWFSTAADARPFATALRRRGYTPRITQGRPT